MGNELKTSPHRERIDTLVSMGFTQAQATHALEASNHDLEEAANYLLSSSSNNQSIPPYMVESLQLEENRKEAAAASNKKTKKKNTSSSTSTTQRNQNVSAASLRAGQAAAARFENANKKFGSNKITTAGKNKEDQTLKRPTNGKMKKSSEINSSNLLLEKRNIKNNHHPNVKMPTQMKDKPREEQIMRCAKRLAPHPHAVDTLLRAFRFIRQNPENEKYRKIDRSSPGFQTALEGKPGALDLIKAMNFVQGLNSMELVLHRNQVDLALLYLGESALEEVRKSEEYITKKQIMAFEKELRQIRNGENTREEDEVIKRAAFVSKLPSEPSSGAGALMQVTLGDDTVMRRFDGDDMLADVIHFIGGHGSLLPEKILSREWCLVDLNRYPVVPIDTENDMMKTLQYIGCWPSGKLALKPSPEYWKEKKEILENAGSSRGLGASS